MYNGTPLDIFMKHIGYERATLLKLCENGTEITKTVLIRNYFVCLSEWSLAFRFYKRNIYAFFVAAYVLQNIVHVSLPTRVIIPLKITDYETPHFAVF